MVGLEIYNEQGTVRDFWPGESWLYLPHILPVYIQTVHYNSMTNAEINKLYLFAIAPI